MLLRLRWFAVRALGREVNLRRVQLQLAVNEPKITVAAMQGFRMRRVAEPDYLDDVFQRESDEANLAILGLPQLRLIGLRGVLDVIVQVRRDHDEKAFVVEPVVDHALIDALGRNEIDLVAFTSASQASNLFTVAQNHGKEASLKQSLGGTLVASIGPVCSVALRKFAVRVDIEAKPPKLGPFIEAINTVLSGRRPLGKS
jgi:Uroporphyrinogen-III synthase HemD